MAKTANLNIRIDPETKAGAEQLFARFGITITDAVNIFLHQAVMEGGIPFEMKLPRYTPETEQAFREARAIMTGQLPAKGYLSAGALFAELDQEADGAGC